ncbi:MAG: PIG-L deacetylase family protein [Burkholderiaceae bacterium]
MNPRRIVGQGTSEARWQEWFQRRPLPRREIASLLGGSTVVHVIAPHPDDEILGCGGLIRQASRLGAAVRIVAVTDGEASHPRSRYWPTAALARLRTRESERALQRLSVPAQRDRLRLADGKVERHEAELVAALCASVAPGDTVVAPWQLDGHPDHEATARASRMAAHARGARFLEVPIWGWHWADPASEVFPWHRAASLVLDIEDRQAKSLAISSFHSQLRADPSTGKGPVLPGFALERLGRPFEVLFL